MKHPFYRVLQVAAIVFAGCGAAMPAMAQEKAVAVLAKDGSCYEIALNRVERINFNPSDVEVVGAAGEVKSIGYADIDRILIGSELSGIDALTAAGAIAVWPTVTTGTLNISGAAEGAAVEVFDTAGSLVHSAVSPGSAFSVDISDAKAGMLIVRIGGRSVKIIKK